MILYKNNIKRKLAIQLKVFKNINNLQFLESNYEIFYVYYNTSFYKSSSSKIPDKILLVSKTNFLILLVMFSNFFKKFYYYNTTTHSFTLLNNNIIMNSRALTKNFINLISSLSSFRVKGVKIKRSIFIRLKNKFKKPLFMPRYIRRFFLKKLKKIKFKNKFFLSTKLKKSFPITKRNVHLYFLLKHYCKIKQFKKNNVKKFNSVFFKKENYVNCSYIFFNLNKKTFIKTYSFFFYLSGWNFLKKAFFKRIFTFFFSMKPKEYNKNKFLLILFKKNILNKTAVKMSKSNITSLNLCLYNINSLLFSILYSSLEKTIRKKNYKIAFWRRRKKNKVKNSLFFLKNLLTSKFFEKDVHLSMKSLSKINLWQFSGIYYYLFFYKNYIHDSKYLKNYFSKNKFHTKQYNNYLPLSIMNFGLKEIIFTKFQKNFTPTFFKFIYYYISNYVELLTKCKLFIKLKSKIKINTLDKNHLLLIFNKHRFYQSKVGRGFFLLEMLEIMWLSFFYKDLNLFMNWFTRTMERIQFKNHKKLLSVIKSIIFHYSDFFIYKNRLKGFFFDIRGKVGVSGNAKKRHFSFHVGKYSKTTKHSKFDYQDSIVRTFTGALGVKMIIFY